MKFRGITYSHKNPALKYLAIVGYSFFIITFLTMFGATLLSNLEHSFSFFKSAFLTIWGLTFVAYFLYSLNPKFKIIEPVFKTGEILISENIIQIDNLTFEVGKCDLINFKKADFSQVKGGMYAMNSSHGTENELEITTPDGTQTFRYLIDSKLEYDQLVQIAKKWKNDGRNVKAVFDLV